MTAPVVAMVLGLFYMYVSGEFSTFWYRMSGVYDRYIAEKNFQVFQRMHCMDGRQTPRNPRIEFYTDSCKELGLVNNPQCMELCIGRELKAIADNGTWNWDVWERLVMEQGLGQSEDYMISSTMNGFRNCLYLFKKDNINLASDCFIQKELWRCFHSSFKECPRPPQDHSILWNVGQKFNQWTGWNIF